MTDIEIIALLGCARSGSTMLEGKLQAAADLTALGEVTYIWRNGFLQNELCGCGAPFFRCEFWSAVLSEGFGEITSTDALRFDAAFSNARGRVLDWNTQLGRPPPVDPLFRDVAEALYSAAYKIGGRRALLDSSKTARFIAALQAAAVGDVVPVHIFRSARPNVYSLLTPKPRPQSRDGGKATMAKSRSVLHATAQWNLSNFQAARVVARHQGRKATVSYTRFCRSPDEQLQALMSELGLRPRLGPEPWHSVSGNPMRFEADRLRLRPDERWKTGLGRLDQQIINLASDWQEKRLERLALDDALANGSVRSMARGPWGGAVRSARGL